MSQEPADSVEVAFSGGEEERGGAAVGSLGELAAAAAQQPAHDREMAFAGRAHQGRDAGVVAFKDLSAMVDEPFDDGEMPAERGPD